jgi:hypothetical protein
MKQYPSPADKPDARRCLYQLLGLAFILLGLALALPVAALACDSGGSGWTLRSAPLPTVAQGKLPASMRPTLATAPCSAPIRRVGVPGPLLRGPDALQGTSVPSTNWAGYDATGGGFTSVTASWVEPTIPPSSAETYAAFWVGLDGDGSSTVEQTGTMAYSQNGSVSYDAWYEMYPGAEVLIPSLTIGPGDLMTGTVTSMTNGAFTLKLTDDTTHHIATESESNTDAKDYSAEVIAEAPTDGQTDNLLPLANFGTVDFTGCTFNNRPISAFDWNQINMVSDGGSTLASASALGADGASFSVTTALTPVTITSVAPASGLVGSAVTLSGSGFSGATAVNFNGTAATFTVNSDTQISATVPSGATSGPISVTTPGGTATSATSFTVIPAPTLTAFTPSAGSLGDSVFLSGSGFGSATAVRFGATAAHFVLNGDTLITATVPADASTSKITVTTPGGTATSATSFTVLAVTAKLTLKLKGLSSGALKLGGRLTATGTVTPTSLAGSRVALTVQRKRGSTWHEVESLARTVSAHGAWSWAYKPAKRGSYRLRAAIAKTGTSTAAATKWLTFRVK